MSSRYIVFVFFLLLTACQTIETHQSVIHKVSIPANAETGQYVSHTKFTAQPFAQGEISRFMFVQWSGPEIPVWAYVPYEVDPAEAPIFIMLHGAKRNPARYLLEWQPLAQQGGFIVLAPEFAKKDFPKSAHYNQGNVFNAKTKQVNDEADWSFSAIEPLFDYAVNYLGSDATTYSLTGHSAGSQFVHRFMYHKPNARVKRYFAANAGWYTLPDMTEVYPYGLAGSGISDRTLKNVLAKDVVVLVGDQDNNANHSSLRRTPEALRQGLHRFARGQYFFETARKQAERLDVDFGWQLVVVEGVAHSNGGMAKGAVPYID